MPVYNGDKYLRKAIDSIINQTFADWDFWAINEFGSDDGSAQTVMEYAQKDERFHLVQNQERLGLAESLNLGFRLSRGEYIARLDADDLAHPERFAKQVALLDANPNVGICGTWQHHFGRNAERIHKTPVTAEQSRANLLFYCDLCHSTLMLRRSVWVENDFFYDKRYFSEDYELWTRAMLVTDIVNIPEVLGEYRVGKGNITAKKHQKINEESGKLVARTLWCTLGMKIAPEDVVYFNGWKNFYVDAPNERLKKERLHRFEELLREIWAANCHVGFYAPQCLLNTFASKWGWAKYGASLWNSYDVQDIDAVFRILAPKEKRRTITDIIFPKGSWQRRFLKSLLGKK